MPEEAEGEFTPYQKRKIREHDGETKGKCRNCGLTLSPLNPRWLGWDPYDADVHGRFNFLDGCKDCVEEIADSI